MEQVVLGPVLKEEADLLRILARVTAAKTVVEFGYYEGRSAQSFLDGMDKDATLYSFDIEQRNLLNDPRLRFKLKDMRKVVPEDFDNKKIDLVFFDASHILDYNIKTFENIESSLTEESIVLVHDTGYWNTSLFNDEKFGVEKNGKRYHQPDEIAFVYWLRNRGYADINVRTGREIRHGISMLQKTGDLM